MESTARAVDLHGHSVWPGDGSLAMGGGACCRDFVRGVSAPWTIVLLGCAWLAVGYTAMAALMLRRLCTSIRRSRRCGTRPYSSARPSIATLAIGIGYIGIHVAAGVVPGDAFARTVAQFWIGDLIGIVVTLPMLLVLTRRREASTAARRPSRPRAGRVNRRGAVHRIRSWRRRRAQALLHPFSALIWIAMRRGMPGTAAPSAGAGRPHCRADVLAGAFTCPGMCSTFSSSCSLLALTGTVPGGDGGRTPRRRAEVARQAVRTRPQPPRGGDERACVCARPRA